MAAAKKATREPKRRVGAYQEATTKKLSVSIDVEALRWAQKVAADEGRSVSAVVSDAVNHARRLQALRELLAELGTDDITEEDREQVRAEWRQAGLIP